MAIEFSSTKFVSTIRPTFEASIVLCPKVVLGYEVSGRPASTSYHPDASGEGSTGCTVHCFQKAYDEAVRDNKISINPPKLTSEELTEQPLSRAVRHKLAQPFSEYVQKICSMVSRPGTCTGCRSEALIAHSLALLSPDEQKTMQQARGVLDSGTAFDCAYSPLDERRINITQNDVFDHDANLVKIFFQLSLKAANDLSKQPLSSSLHTPTNLTQHCSCPPSSSTTGNTPVSASEQPTIPIATTDTWVQDDQGAAATEVASSAWSTFVADFRQIEGRSESGATVGSSYYLQGDYDSHTWL